MCIASKYLNEIKSLTDRVENDHNKLKKSLQGVERDIVQYYHKLEKVKFSASEGYYLAKELQDLLRSRRMLKKEIYNLNAMKDTIKLQEIRVKSIPGTQRVLAKIHRDNADSYANPWKEDFSAERYLN